MSEQIVLNLVSIVLGIMLFFSFVVAPLTFKVLPTTEAGIYIRIIFPYYYIINLILMLVVTGCYVSTSTYSLDFYLSLMVTILFCVSLLILMPTINKYRELKDEKKFRSYHLVSVVINLIQMGSLGLILL
jgi:hypothetical protein